MLDTIERETGPSPQHSVIWLHGLGADGGDFVPILPELVRPDWPPIRFVFPPAPVRPVTINNGVPMLAWYDIRDADLAHRADEARVAASMQHGAELNDGGFLSGVTVCRSFPTHSYVEGG